MSTGSVAMRCNKACKHSVSTQKWYIVVNYLKFLTLDKVAILTRGRGERVRLMRGRGSKGLSFEI